MRSILNQLESNEAILLMYLADELPGGDRAQIERRLSSDASLRTQLDQLRMAQGAIDVSLKRLDAVQTLPGSQGPAVRQIVRSMRQWHVNRVAEAARPRAALRNLRFPWWSYPLAAAAAVTFAFLAWWWNLPEQVLPQVVQNPPEQIAPDPDDADDTDYQAPIVLALDNASELTNLERELQAVRELGDWLQ